MTRTHDTDWQAVQLGAPVTTLGSPRSERGSAVPPRPVSGGAWVALVVRTNQGSPTTGVPGGVVDRRELFRVLPELTLKRSRTQPETRLDVARRFLERELGIELPTVDAALAEAEK